MFRQSIRIALLIFLLNSFLPEPTHSQNRSETIPPLDVSKHTVPLEEIYFDTFRSNPPYLRLPDTPQAFIDDIIDAIPPLNNPQYETVDEAIWMHEEDMVIGYAAGGEAWAFPIRIMNFHEMVNDTLNGEPVAISYCPLCFCVAVYHRELNGEILEFGNTNALFESDFVMLDYQTGSYWWQADGQAIVGTLAGEKLTLLPSLTTTWEKWVELHPNTLVLSRRTGFVRNYNSDPFAGFLEFLDDGNFAFPVLNAGKDDRNPPSTRMLVFSIEDELFAIDVERGEKNAYNAQFGSTQFTVLIDPEHTAGAVYSSNLNEQRIFIDVVDDLFVDSNSGVVWNLAGQNNEGEASSLLLEQLPSKLIMWYEVTAINPNVRMIGETAIEQFSIYE